MGSPGVFVKDAVSGHHLLSRGPWGLWLCSESASLTVCPEISKAHVGWRGLTLEEEEDARGQDEGRAKSEWSSSRREDAQETTRGAGL